MTGNRKLKVFYLTSVMLVLLVIGAMMASVQFTGDNIIALAGLFAANAAFFVGGNAAEHFAAAKKPAT